MADFNNQFALCPFFLEKQEDKYRIKCEGVCPNTTIQLTFKGSKNKYLQDFCCGYYRECRIYKMLMGKYP